MTRRRYIEQELMFYYHKSVTTHMTVGTRLTMMNEIQIYHQFDAKQTHRSTADDGIGHDLPEIDEENIL